MTVKVEAVLDRLENARQGWWICSSVCNLILMIVASFSILGIFVLADVLFQFSQTRLAMLLILWLVISAAMVGYAAYRLSHQRRTLEGAARRVELAFPEARSHLINLIQLSSLEPADAGGFQAAAIAEAASQVQEIPFHSAASRHTRWSRWRLGLQTPRDLAEVIVAAGLVMLVAVAVHWVVPMWRSSADRLLTPWRFVPQTGAVQILEVAPGDGDLLVGSRLTITARIAERGGRKPHATLLVIGGDEAPILRQMMPNDNHSTFTCAIPSVTDPFRYQLQIGDSQTNFYRIGVRQLPAIRDLAVTYQFPEYLARDQQVVQQKHADLVAPQYSVAHVKFIASTELSRGHVQLGNRQISGRVGEDGKTLNVSIPMNEATTFTVHLFNDLGHTDSQPRVNSIRISEDAPPTVQIAKPSADVTTAPDAELSMVVRAADDHGLTRVLLEAKATGESDVNANAAFQPMHTWDVSASAATLHHKLKFDSARFKPGQTVLVRAVALDGRKLPINGTRLSPQQTASAAVRIRLISPRRDAETPQSEVVEAKPEGSESKAETATREVDDSPQVAEQKTGINKGPLAQLPSELEETLGELLEQEAGLFDQLGDMAESQLADQAAGNKGPTPEQTQRALDMMAKRQADLRTQAESVDARFQLLDYQQTDLRRMIAMMKSIEADLRTGRYQSALRRRQFVLDGLAAIKTYLGGELEIRRDQTSELPAEIQEQLLGSMLEASPAGWEALNRKYFQRLSGEDQIQAEAAAQAADPQQAAE